MADLPVPGSINASPNAKVHKLWTEQQIAEGEMAIKKLEADAENLIRGKLKKLEADIIMHKRRVSMLYDKLDKLDKFGSEDIIDVNGTEVKRIENKGGLNG